MQLYNTLSAEERTILIDTAGKHRLTLSFYAYAQIENPTHFRNNLFLSWNPIEVLGRIYVATEGINAQLSLPADQFYLFKESLDVYPFLQNIRLNIAVEHDNFSFLKLTIKVRDKIVADGLNDPTFDPTNIGTHLDAKQFNALMTESDTIVVDMRNHYESEIGHFVNAIKPDVETFRESLPIIESQLADHKIDKKILMYCTGGIRCEKASAYLKHKGFQNVYQLQGGIIEYTKQIKEQNIESQFIGKNFVFDHRLGERITNHIVSQCHQCGQPCDTHTNCINDGCHLLFIQCENCAQKLENCCSTSCQKTIHLPLDEQVKLRSGLKNGNKIFKKGKSDQLEYKNNNPVKAVFVENQKPKTKKIILGKAIHYYPKTSIGQFLLNENSLQIGDTILIQGKTTGSQTIKINALYVDDKPATKAEPHQIVSLKLAFRIRLSDKIYLLLE